MFWRNKRKQIDNKIAQIEENIERISVLNINLIDIINNLKNVTIKTMTEIIEKHNGLINVLDEHEDKILELSVINNVKNWTVEEITSILDSEKVEDVIEYDSLEKLDVDIILDKINKEGIESLTKKEREYLKNQK